MTPVDMRGRARQWRNCGLDNDALLIEAAADVVEAIGPPAKRDVVSEFRPELRAALARVEALKP